MYVKAFLTVGFQIFIFRKKCEEEPKIITSFIRFGSVLTATPAGSTAPTRWHTLTQYKYSTGPVRERVVEDQGAKGERGVRVTFVAHSHPLR